MGLLSCGPLRALRVLIQHLIAANLVFPDFRGDALKVIRGVDLPLGFRVVFRRGDGQVIAFALEARDGLVRSGLRSKCRSNKTFAQCCHLLEERAIRSERHAREVELEEISISFAMGAIENSIYVLKDFLGLNNKVIGIVYRFCLAVDLN